jgi:CitMHS family citrate-Mg2+:H+ or citrate-Ca2+:H+ symporter
MTNSLLGIMPESLGPHLPFILCVMSVPLSMLVGSDTVYMVMAPILGNMTVAFGGSMMQAGCALMIGSCLSANLSLVGPTPYLALGLAECEMGSHLKANFLPTWILGVALAVVAVFAGVFPF